MEFKGMFAIGNCLLHLLLFTILTKLFIKKCAIKIAHFSELIKSLKGLEFF